MKTRLQLRTTIWERPEETTCTPLWSGGARIENLTVTNRAYQTTFPRQATLAAFSHQMLQGAARCEGLVELTNQQQRF